MCLLSHGGEKIPRSRGVARVRQDWSGDDLDRSGGRQQFVHLLVEEVAHADPVGGRVEGSVVNPVEMYYPVPLLFKEG